jgi:hypothetical protein
MLNVLRRNVAFSVGCDTPLLSIMMIFWRTSSFKKGAPNGQHYLQRSVTPDQIFQQNREGPIGNGPHAPLPYDALKVGSCSTVYTAPAVL